jgi:hypothetical protein
MRWRASQSGLEFLSRTIKDLHDTNAYTTDMSMNREIGLELSTRSPGVWFPSGTAQHARPNRHRTETGNVYWTSCEMGLNDLQPVI